MSVKVHNFTVGHTRSWGITNETLAQYVITSINRRNKTITLKILRSEL